MDFIHFTHGHHTWWGLDARQSDFWSDPIWPTFGSFSTLSNGMCPLPFLRTVCFDFNVSGYIQPLWKPNDAHYVTLNVGHAWLTPGHFAVLPIFKHVDCVHDHCREMHGRISFILHMVITHNEVLMHVSQLFDLIQYDRLLGHSVLCQMECIRYHIWELSALI